MIANLETTLNTAQQNMDQTQPPQNNGSNNESTASEHMVMSEISYGVGGGGSS